MERAAAGWGVELEYTDTWGRTHAASDETLRGALAALGIPLASDADLERAATERDLSRWSRAFDPTVVVFEDSDALPLRIPAERAGGSVKIEFRWENGEIEHHWFWLPELQDLERVSIAGQEFISKRVPLPALRLGYHDLRVYWMKEPELEVFEDARFIVCPRRAKEVEGRPAGVAVSLYGVRSARNWGCGDFTDLRALIDTLAPSGAAFIALNPLHAIPNRQPYNTSPYLPLCSLYRNYLYLDVERVPGFLPEDVPHRRSTRCARPSWWNTSASRRSSCARCARRSNDLQKSGHTGAFEEFARIEGTLLHDFAVFCALDAEHPPPESRDLAVEGLAGGVSGSPVAGRGGIRRATSRRCSVLQVLAVAGGPATGGGAGSRHRARDENRAVSRSGAGHGPVRRGSVDEPAFLCERGSRGGAAG